MPGIGNTNNLLVSWLHMIPNSQLSPKLQMSVSVIYAAILSPRSMRVTSPVKP